MESTTVTPTIRRLFLTASQNPGWSVGSIASPKLSSVGEVENQVGVMPSISASGLNAVETIQKTGKHMTTKIASPTAFQAARWSATPAKRRGHARSLGPRTMPAHVEERSGGDA